MLRGTLMKSVIFRMDVGTQQRLDKVSRRRVFAGILSGKYREFAFEPDARPQMILSPDEKQKLENCLQYLSSDDETLISESLEAIHVIAQKSPYEVFCSGVLKNEHLRRICELAGEWPASVFSLILEMVNNTSMFDDTLVDDCFFYDYVNQILGTGSDDEVIDLALRCCCAVLRRPAFRQRAFEKGVYNSVRQLLERTISEPVLSASASFLLKSIEKPGGVPDFFTCVMQCVPFLLRSSHDTFHAALSILCRLMVLSEQADQCLSTVVKSDGMIDILADNLQSIDDLDVLRVVVQTTTFGDTYIHTLVEKNVLASVYQRMYDKHNDGLMVVILQLIADWATHTTKFHENIFDFAKQLDFMFLISNSSHGVKEQAIHALRILASVTPASRVFELISENVFTNAVLLISDCDITSDMAYELCLFTWTLLQKAEKNEVICNGIKDTVKRDVVMAQLEQLAVQAAPSDIRTYANLIISAARSGSQA